MFGQPVRVQLQRPLDSLRQAGNGVGGRLGLLQPNLASSMATCTMPPRRQHGTAATGSSAVSSARTIESGKRQRLANAAVSCAPLKPSRRFSRSQRPPYRMSPSCIVATLDRAPRRAWCASARCQEKPGQVWHRSALSWLFEKPGNASLRAAVQWAAHPSRDAPTCGACGLRSHALFFWMLRLRCTAAAVPRLHVCPHPLPQHTHHCGKHFMPGCTTSVRKGLPCPAAIAKTRQRA